VRTAQVAVAVHVYYPELWESIARRLAALPRNFDLYVTTVEAVAEEVRTRVMGQFPDAKVLVFPNLGMDILPFLMLVPQLVADGYEAVCKVHTKRNNGDPRYAAWRESMLDALIGSSTLFNEVTSRFVRDRTLSLAGPSCFFVSGQTLVLKNRERVGEVARSLYACDVPRLDWGFFAGTMFWARPQALLPLARYAVQHAHELGGEYQGDGKLEHAYERLFGLIPVMQGEKVGLLVRNGVGSTDLSLHVGSPHDWISHGFPADVMQKALSLQADVALIRESGLFDADFYRSQLSVPDLNIDPVVHYLLEGYFTGLRPARSFDQDAYSARHGLDDPFGVNPFVHFLRTTPDPARALRLGMLAAVRLRLFDLRRSTRRRLKLLAYGLAEQMRRMRQRQRVSVHD
jgi:microcystin-dependent protein